jgi:phage protein D
MPGDPTAAAEGQIFALGFRVGVSGVWSVKRARHSISRSGFTTTIETEKPKIEAT